MRARKTWITLTWIILVCFLFSLEGTRVLAIEILDSPGTQDSVPATPDASADSSGATTAAGPADSTETASPSEDEVAPEPLTVPANEDECVLVDRFDWYNIPSAELSADDNRSGPCGPYSMTSALKGRGMKITYFDVMKMLKPEDCFTAPGEMVDFAIDKGVSCRRIEPASLDQILNLLRTDKRSIISFVHCSDLEPDGDSFKVTKADVQHWVNIVGMRLKDGKPVSVFLKDSAWSHGSGRVREMPANEFDFRYKEMKGLFSLAINPKRMILVLGALGSADFGDRLAAYLQYMFAGEVVAEGISTGYKALGAMWRGLQEFVHTGNPTALLNAITHLQTAVVKVVAGLAGWVCYQIGAGIDAAGKFLSEKAQELWKNGGILGKIAAVPMAVLGGALEVVGGIIKTVGNLVASVAETIGNVINDISDAIAKFFKKIADALNPANWF
jgi:hypothetical protein